MNEPTAALPYGKQRLLEIVLAISTGPGVLLLVSRPAFPKANGSAKALRPFLRTG